MFIMEHKKALHLKIWRHSPAYPNQHYPPLSHVTSTAKSSYNENGCVYINQSNIAFFYQRECAAA